MSTSSEDSLPRRIGQSITLFAFLSVATFLVVLFGAGDRPAASQRGRDEVLAIIPTTGAREEQQPLSRALDQLTGIMEGLSALHDHIDLDLRAEFIPYGDPWAAELHYVRDQVTARTKVLVAPGTSEDAERVFGTCDKETCVEACSSADMKELGSTCARLSKIPLLIISSTSAALRTKVLSNYNLAPAVNTNTEIAKVIANKVRDFGSGRPGTTIAINYSKTDTAYATELAEILAAELRVPLDSPASSANVRILIGNETWSHRMPDGIETADLVILSDGLNSPETIRDIRTATKEDARILLVRTDPTWTSLFGQVAGCGVCDHRAELGRFTWHVTARSSICQLAVALAYEIKQPITPVTFTVLPIDRDPTP